MVVQFQGKSEESKAASAAGVESDPYLVQLAKQKGVPLSSLIKKDMKDLSEEELMSVIKFSSVVLPKAVERKMIDEFRENRDYLNELLFNHNARAATKIASMYFWKYSTTVRNVLFDQDDFLSAARFGLWNAATRFDLDRTFEGKPVKFLTFATPWMFRYITEMIYRRENMEVRISLDANPYGDEEGPSGEELFSEEDIAESFKNMVSFSSAPQAPVLEDEENELDEERLKIGEEGDPAKESDEAPSDEFDPEEFDERRAADYFEVMKKLVKNEDFDEALALEAIDVMCGTIVGIKDAQERAIVTFLSKRYISKALFKLKDKCSKKVVMAGRMIRDVPSSRAKLLAALKMTDAEFKKVCNSYAAKYSRR